MVRPDSRMEIGPPVASGSTASTARAKARTFSLSSGSPVGVASRRTLPSAVRQLREISSGRLSSVIGLALSRSRMSSRSSLSGLVKTASTRWRRAGSAMASLVIAAASRFAASAPGPLLLVGRPREVAGPLFERGDDFLVGRRPGAPATPGPDRAPSPRGDQGELGLLVGGNEAVDGPDGADLRRGLEPAGQSSAAGPRREHVDRIRAGGGIAPQVEIGRDRFDLGAAQVHRVEIEAEEIEQRQPAMANGDVATMIAMRWRSRNRRPARAR